MSNGNNENLVENGTLWLPESAWSATGSIDALFDFIYYGSIVIFIALIGTMIYFIVKYRKTPQNPKPTSQVEHHRNLEIAWSVIPLILVMIVFLWGFKDYLNLIVPPAHAKEYKVTAQQWTWTFDYPQEGITLVNQLVVPVHKPVKLIMTSLDVIHSFYLPNFRVKKDVLPRRYSSLWFKPERTGRFQIFCTEFCGDRHSYMLADLVVLNERDYADWLKKEKTKTSEALPLVALGEKLYNSYCLACHSLDGSLRIGPSWKGLWQLEREFTDGTKAIADENYLRQSIVNPAAKIVKGYPNQMVAFTTLKEREIDGIIEYIKTIK